MSNPIRDEWRSDDGSVRLILGDCLEVLPTLETGSVDAVVFDPPYAIPTIVASQRETTRNVGDLSMIEAAFRMLFEMSITVIRDVGRVFAFCDGTSYPVLFRAIYGKMPTALLVWNKGRIGMGREFRKSHELILHGWKPGTPIYLDGVGRSDILRFDPVEDCARVHPAEKPVDLLSELLTVCGNVVLDTHAGSGTTGVACVRTGRRFVGIEIEPKYWEIAVRRVRAELERFPLFEPPEPRQIKLLD